MCLKNINNNEKHSAKLVLSIFNPLHHTRDFLASFRGQHDYFGVKQAFWQREDNFAYFEMAENPSKSGKHLKSKAISSFLGNVGLRVQSMKQEVICPKIGVCAYFIVVHHVLCCIPKLGIRNTLALSPFPTSHSQAGSTI